MTGQKTLILIDGHALAYRMFFALERTGMKTSSGQPVWAVFGFFKAVFDLLKNVKPDAIAVSFDLSRKTFRTEIYPEYKANRSSMPDSMREQIGLLYEGLGALGIPIYTMENFEADDVIGTIAREARELGHRAYILTGDQDSFQLVDDKELVKILVPSKGELIEYGKDKVYEKFGVWPNQIIDYKGLRGDTSDNIPGVKGVGEKTAVKLISEFGTVENILANIDKISSKSLQQKLENDREMAIKSKYLATINENVDIDFDFECTKLTMPDVEKVIAFFKKMEFYNFLKMLPKILMQFNGGIVPELTETKPQEDQQIPQGQLQLDFTSKIVEQAINKPEFNTEFEKQTVDTKEKFDSLLKILKAQKVISLDTETTGIDTLTADLVGISVGWDEKLTFADGKIDCTNSSTTKTAYIPVGHEEGDQLDFNETLDAFKEILEDKNIGKVLQNAKYEINIFKNYDITLEGLIYDTMVASYVKDPAYKHGLKQQALAHLGFQMQDIETLIGKGKSAITMDKVKIEDASDYACADAYSTLELAKYYESVLSEREKKLFYDIEMPLIEVLADMERTGVSLDTEYLQELSVELQGNLSVIENKIFEIAGMTFNINSPKQVGDVLFEKMQIPAKGKTKTKTGYSTSAKVLELLAKDYPIAKLLLEQRHYAKLKSTYIDALPQLVNPVDKRIHTSFNQAVTTTGRLSSSNPNLQNIPIRTELGNRIRAAFAPEDKENGIMLAADYSQIELRLLAHFSKDTALTEAFKNNIDVHAATASKVFDVPLEEVTKDMRRKAKAVNFGIIYGQTSYGLSESLGITPGEAKEFIQKYFAMYPQIENYIQQAKETALSQGYAETMFGRKRYFGEDLHSRNKMIREFAERAAVNAALQGTAADLIKLAMIELYKKLKEHNLKSKMVLQVHDELIVEVEKDELNDVKKLVLECMGLNQPLDVPLDIDMQYGSNWMEAK